MVLAEIAYLAEKNKIDTDLQEAEVYIDKYKNIKERPMTINTVKMAFDIDDIPELHDRLIAASGKALDIEIITNDPDIQKSRHVNTIWK